MLPIKRANWVMGLLVWLFSTAVTVVPASPAEQAAAVVVGRIFTIEGDLLRYVPETKDWVAVVRDAPFGAEDTFFSGESGMAELIVPNGTWIRIGNSTQIQFITLEGDLTEMDLASGIGRFTNKSTQTAINVTSPFGYVLADPGTVFDLSVGEASVEVVAIRGTVSFVHPSSDARYDVAAGSPSLLADRTHVSSGERTVDSEWDRWNTDRENFWMKRTTAGRQTAEYLPPGLQDDAYALEENGRWERVPYEGAERWFWRPTTVAVGWSPFTVGRWTDWHGEQTWIPAEPFGYATHHYGNWIYVGKYWYWAPPVANVRIGIPLLDVGFFWYPGRVSWIYSGSYIGWVPLAPRETYYCRRHWGGPHTVIVDNLTISRITIDVGRHAYIDRAIIVDRSNFSSRNNYRNVRVTNISHTTIINNYRAAPVVDNTVIRNYTTSRQRYNYTNLPLKEKPHDTAISRIRHNETIIHEGRIERAAVVRERLKGIPEGRVDREARIERPKTTNYVVPASDARRPKAELNLPQREIRGTSKGAPPPERPAPRPERASPARPAQPGEPAGRPPEHVTPARPAQPSQPVQERPAPARPAAQQPKPARTEQPAPKPERVLPAQPAQPGGSATLPPEHETPARPPQTGQPRPERVMPPRPAQPGETPTRPERAMPARPGQPVQPGPEHPAPARPAAPQPKPARTEQPTPRSERVLPARPAQSGEPAAQPPERETPARSLQTGQPRPERALPARPAQPAEPPARPAERAMPARPAQPVQPGPEHPAPAKPAAQQPKPAQTEQPAPKPEHVTTVTPAQPNEPVEQRERAIPVRPDQPDRGRPGR